MMPSSWSPEALLDMSVEVLGDRAVSAIRCSMVGVELGVAVRCSMVPQDNLMQGREGENVQWGVMVKRQ